MEDRERQELMQRCHDAELRAKTLAECLDLIAGKFSAITSGLVGMRINRLEDARADHGSRIGTCETNDAKFLDTAEKARRAYESLLREVRRRDFETRPEQAAAEQGGPEKQAAP